MGQQPNIELEISDLPRPTPAPAAPRRWKPGRPGELSSPDEVPWGGAFGTTGPDQGYAFNLLASLDFELGAGEHRHNVDVGLAAVAGARASRFGRAPTIEDVEIAAAIFRFDANPEAGPPERALWFANVGHDTVRLSDLVALVPLDVLDATPVEVRRRIAAGEQLLAL